MKEQNIVQGGMLDTEVTQAVANNKFIRGWIRQKQRPLLLAGYFVKKYVSKIFSLTFFPLLFFFLSASAVRKQQPYFTYFTLIYYHSVYDVNAGTYVHGLDVGWAINVAARELRHVQHSKHPLEHER